MSSSDLSELSSSLSSHEDVTPVSVSRGKLEHYFKHGSSAAPQSPPVKKKRPPSPPHEYVLADNPDIAVSSIRSVLVRSCIARVRFNKNSADLLDAQFICIFRSRFSEAFPKTFPHYGPQDIERGVVDTIPGDQIERLLCALLGLVLNRKKDIEYVSSADTQRP